jgi:hypothetical protein
MIILVPVEFRAIARPEPSFDEMLSVDPAYVNVDGSNGVPKFH